MVDSAGLEPGLHAVNDDRNFNTQTRKHDNPLFTTSSLMHGRQFPLPKWKPRSGRNMVYLAWEVELAKLLAALGTDTSFIAKAPPPQPDTVRNKDRARARDEREHWVAVNTSLFWHVLPSLDISGTSWQRDTDHISTLFDKAQADGAGLITWARTFTDLTSKDAQYKLVDHVRSARLKPQSTRAQLERHAQDLPTRLARSLVPHDL